MVGGPKPRNLKRKREEEVKVSEEIHDGASDDEVDNGFKTVPNANASVDNTNKDSKVEVSEPELTTAKKLKDFGDKLDEEGPEDNDLMLS